MNHKCIGNAVLKLNTAGYILVLASKNIEQNNFVHFNYNGSKNKSVVSGICFLLTLNVLINKEIWANTGRCAGVNATLSICE
jgi:hypothetical protein